MILSELTKQWENILLKYNFISDSISVSVILKNVLCSSVDFIIIVLTNYSGSTHFPVHTTI